MSDSDNGGDDIVSQDSEEAKRRQKHPENYDPSNKLRMGKFHRYDISKPKKKRGGTNNKKRIRDIERLLAKTEGKMPEEIRTEKLKELKELKKGEKSKREAEKFESRYKKIRFFEKKKIIRRLEKLDKKIKEGGVEEEETLKVEKQQYRNYLTYVNNFPETKKYLSLFPEKDSEKSKQERDVMMAKILKTAEVKSSIREKELLEMDKVDDVAMDESDQERKAAKKIKEMTKKDAFFTVEDAPAVTLEKKIVQRNGFIVNPNQDKRQSFTQSKPQFPGWDDDVKPSGGKFGFNKQQPQQQSNYQKKPEVKAPQQPLKINPNSYRVKGGQTGAEVSQKTHIKF